MEQTFEMALARQCAPTLAGIKPANLFPWKDWKRARLNLWRKNLSPYGIELRILKACPVSGNCLIYLFRTAWLCDILSDPSARSFLYWLGYPDADYRVLLRQLSERLHCMEEFPHEIGIFLGYPLEDVTGFMQHHGKNYTYCGCWKVYGNPEEAKRRFAQYRRCTALYCENVRRGIPLTRLIAAA